MKLERLSRTVQLSHTHFLELCHELDVQTGCEGSNTDGRIIILDTEYLLDKN